MDKRADYIDWNTYFMNLAILSSFRSKDPSCQVGCCIVNNNNIICSIGYNGMPIGISDEKISWGKNNDNELDNKYPYVVHAESNALLNKNTQNLQGCILYCTHFCCRECVKLIIQSGISKIYYLNYKEDKASEKMLNMVGIPYIQLKLKQQIKMENTI